MPPTYIGSRYFEFRIRPTTSELCQTSLTASTKAFYESKYQDRMEGVREEDLNYNGRVKNGP
jgi:hypothetical protein